MKYTPFLIVVSLVAFVARGYGQAQAKLSVLDIGPITGISVSTEGKIWLADRNGSTYYTNRIDSNWHYGPKLFEKNELLSSTANQILFLNKDTALIIACGYWSSADNYFLTMDGGKTLNRFDLGGSKCHFTNIANIKGGVWMDNESGEMLFSTDGYHWKQLNLGYQLPASVSCISMVDSAKGILGTLNHEIYVTSDNWRSIKRIEPRYSQKKNTPKDPDNVKKVLLWKDYIVVNQNNHIYYTSSDSIYWRPFPIMISDFALDSDTQTLWGVTDNLNIVAFSSPTKYELVTNERLSDSPESIKLAGQSLFALLKDHSVCKVNKNGIVYTKFYTTDWNRPKLKIIKRGSKVSWGINWSKIYIAESNTNHWYRENKMSFWMADIRLLDDSTAILWDGKNNYSYSLKEHKATPYTIQSPLESFIGSPIQSFAISSSVSDSYQQDYYFKDRSMLIDSIKITYEKLDDSIFGTQQIQQRGFVRIKGEPFDHKTNINKLKNILIDINSHPCEAPSISHFNITEEDKRRYLANVDKRIIDGTANYRYRERKKVEKDFYYAIPSVLDTLGASTIGRALDLPYIYDGISNWFRFTIVNNANDTLTFSRHCNTYSLPWNLPWIVSYKGIYFACYNVECSRFIKSCLPDNFRDLEVFENSALLMEIADYLWHNKG